MNYIRKKPSSQSGGGYSNNNNNGGQQRSNKPRFSHGSGGGQSHNSGGNRPRKNYGAMREKYLTQARDALASGDRVLAENYFQHADHCFRMIAEENASRPQRVHVPQEQQVVETVPESAGEGDDNGDDTISMNVSSLPAFLTANYEPQKKEDEPVITPNWKEE